MNNVKNILPKVRNIDKIVVFYDDGTFEELNPKKTSKKVKSLRIEYLIVCLYIGECVLS